MQSAECGVRRAESGVRGEAQWSGYITPEQLREAFRTGQMEFSPRNGVTRIGNRQLKTGEGAFLQVLDYVAKKLKFAIVAADDIAGKNGFVSSRADVAVISLDADAGRFMTAAFHEIHHLISRELGETAGRQFTAAVLDTYRTVVGRLRFNDDLAHYEELYKGEFSAEDRTWKVREEMAAQYFGSLAEDNIELLVKRIDGTGGKTLLAKVVDAVKAFRDAISEALQHLAGIDPATRAAMDTSARNARKLFDKFIAAAEQTMEARETAPAEQGEGLRKAAEVSAESGVRSAERKETSSYKSLKGATADELSTLADAKQLLTAGADSEEVRKRTGWFKGYDGQWRIEIDDSKMKLTLPEVLFGKEFARYTELNNRFEKGKSKRGEVSEMINLATELRDQLPKKLDDIVYHAALFEAYPELKNVRVEFAALGDLIDATYEDESNRIVINTSLLRNQDEMREALIHEIQHAVQDIEGLAGGEDITTAGYDRYIRTAGEIEAYDVANRVNLTAEERRNTRPDIDRTDVVFADAGVSWSYGVDQSVVDDYVENASTKRNTKEFIKYADVSDRLVSDLNDEIHLSGFRHALRDNDIRHILNSHGVNTKEKYPVTEQDIKDIPKIVDTYDKVYYKTNKSGNPGVLYVKVSSENIVYFVEGVFGKYGNEDLLFNKQMIKSGYDSIPKLYHDIITKHQSETEFLADLDKIRKAYVQDDSQSLSDNNIISQKSAGSQEADAGETETSSRKVTDEDYMAAVERGDMKTSQEMLDEAAKGWGAYQTEDGRPKVFYHQTDADFTVFDTRHEGAGARDNETPFGIFMKTAPANIGLKGKKQMPLYARLQNPLAVKNRAELVKQLQNLSPAFTEAYRKGKEIDRTFHQRMEDAKAAWMAYLKDHPLKEGQTRSSRYDDPEFMRLFDAEHVILDEWTQTQTEQDRKTKEIIVDALKQNGYDGVVLSEDQGSMGRKTDAYIALDANQVKSADPVTYDDAGNVIPLSERFNEEKEDIRWSRKVTDARAVLAERTLGRDELGAMLDETAEFLRQARKTVDKAAYDAWIQGLRTGGRLPQRTALLKVVRQYNDPKVTGESNEALADRIVERLAEMTDGYAYLHFGTMIKNPKKPKKVLDKPVQM